MTMTLTDLIERVRLTPANRSLDLPYPNIYWVTINGVNRAQVDTYIAGGHTNQALQKACNWCAETHFFRPTRSTAKVRMRRFLLGDLLDNPGAYHEALAKAQAANERDIVEGLLAMPAKVWLQLAQGDGFVTNQHSSDALWSQLAGEINALEQRHLTYI